MNGPPLQKIVGLRGGAACGVAGDEGEGAAEAVYDGVLAEDDHGVEEGWGDSAADDGDAGGVDIQNQESGVQRPILLKKRERIGLPKFIGTRGG